MLRLRKNFLRTKDRPVLAKSIHYGGEDRFTLYVRPTEVNGTTITIRRRSTNSSTGGTSTDAITIYPLRRNISAPRSQEDVLYLHRELYWLQKASDVYATVRKTM